MEWTTQKQTEERDNRERTRSAEKKRIAQQKELEEIALARAKVEREIKVLQFKTSEIHELSADEDDLVAENPPEFSGYEARGRASNVTGRKKDQRYLHLKKERTN